jgi:hypothetical protein
LQHGIAIALVGLLAVLGALVAMYFIRNAKTRDRDRQKSRDDQAHRERVAEKRMAENGGFPLSARFASEAIAPRDTLDPREPSRAMPEAVPIYPQGHRRPGDFGSRK